MKSLSMNKWLNTNQVLVLALSTIALMGLMGCNKSSGGGGSAGGGGGGGSVYSGSFSQYIYTNNGSYVTACSNRSIPTSGGTFSAQSESYYSGSGLNTNWVRVRITNIPSDFNLTTGSVTFWSYAVDAMGNAVSMSQMPFVIEQYGGNGTFIPITTSNTTNYTPGSGANLTSIDFVVKLDNNPGANVLTVALYNNLSASPVHQLESLIPAFYANPSLYSQTHASPLTAMHPLAMYAASGYSDSQYANMASQFCF